MDPLAVQNTCLRATEDALRESSRKAERLIMEGRGNSRAYILARDEIDDGFRRSCADAATRLAEVAGSASRDYASQLEEALKFAGTRAVASMSRHRPGNGGPFETLVDRLTDGVQANVSAYIAATLEDLSINLAGGVHVDRNKSRIISIDNRHGNGQIAIDSNHVQQSAVASMNRGAEVDEIANLLAEMRKVALTEKASIEIQDLLLDAERELQQPQPDTGRLKRLINKMGGFSEKVAASALGGLLSKILTLAAALPQ